MLYEARHQPLLSRAAFLRRVARHAALVVTPVAHRLLHRFHVDAKA